MHDPEFEEYHRLMHEAWVALREAKAASDTGQVATYQLMLRKCIECSEQAKQVMSDAKRRA